MVHASSVSTFHPEISMRPPFVVATLLLAVSVSALAETTDEYTQRVAEQAERTVWRRSREEALAAANSVRAMCVRAAGPMSEVGVCAAQYAADVESVLKESYESTVRMDAKAPTELKRARAAAQAAWVRYRDAECLAVRASYSGGSGAGMAEQGCRANLAAARVRYLTPLPNEE